MTTNTNMILLAAPYIYTYGLLPSSCINTEVKLFNKRLQSLMSTFNYVKGP